MAKECELLGKSYEEIRVVPAAVAAIGEVVVYNEAIGFHLTEHTAVQVAASEAATLIVRADRCRVTKNTGEVWAPGEALYWDPINNWFTNVVGALTLVGWALDDVASAVVIADINFDGLAGFLKA